MNYEGFMTRIMPMIESAGLQRHDVEVVSLMREPIDWLRSWYRYRAREELRDPAHPYHRNYTGDVTLEDFLAAYVSEAPPPFARVGDPVRFLSRSTDDAGPPEPPTTLRDLGPDRIFRYEDNAWSPFLQARIGRELMFSEGKVASGERPAVDPEWRARLSRHYAVYEALARDAGTLSLVVRS